MRLYSFVAAFLALSPLGLCSPTFNHVIHEKRNKAPKQWVRRSPVAKDALLPMRVALTQRNLERGWNFLSEVSSPDSPNFGQHWTAKEVAEMFKPSDEALDEVRAWLIDGGIKEERIALSQGLNWVQFNATVAEAESLLKTKYYIYDHKISGQPHVACREYSVPGHIQKHIDFITPTLHFDARVNEGKDYGLRKRGISPTMNPSAADGVGNSLAWAPKLGKSISIHDIIQQLEKCDEQIVPNCLRALYEFPPNVVAAPGNSYGIVEYTPQAYLPGDLDMFFANFSPRAVGTRPTFDSIDGGVLQTIAESFNYNGESDLDLEYAIALVYPQKVTLYQVGDIVEGASFNNFLDAIDGSYCTFEGGDDPSQDGIYPDPVNGTGAYKGPENCGGFAATKVISTSYGYNEADLTPFYENRQCAEYMKLGLQGVSVLYSSGDYGVAGNGGECIDPVSGNYTNGSYGIFNPSFPSTCPYVTSVGATQVIPGTNIVQALVTGTQPEEACETVIYSGGGFSNVFPLPDYQASAVKNWFAEHPPPYGADRFNNSQQTRAIPDVSANGANYVIAIDGNFSLVYGTSASSPTFGSVVTLINQARLEVGKSSVGFLNPTFYAHPGVFNDITQGGNQGCGTAGFESTTGWDPVTGLGTPNFPRLLKLFLSLP